MGRLKLIFISLIIFLPALSFAQPYYGARISYAAYADNPHPNGMQFMLFYDPQRFQWRQFNVYFDGGYSRFWTSGKSLHYTAINILSAAPVIHYTFIRRGPVLPYLELSIGAAYLDQTRLDFTYRNQRNFGVHFAFQDRFGFGVSFGKQDQFSLGIHIVHYSNAGISENNAGLTAPLNVDFTYRFPSKC